MEKEIACAVGRGLEAEKSFEKAQGGLVSPRLKPVVGMHTLGKAHLVDFVVEMKGSFCQVASLLGNSKAKISVVNGRCQVLGGRAWGVCAERRRSVREETDENVMCKCDIWGWDDVCGGGSGGGGRPKECTTV